MKLHMRLTKWNFTKKQIKNKAYVTQFSKYSFSVTQCSNNAGLRYFMMDAF